MPSCGEAREGLAAGSRGEESGDGFRHGRADIAGDGIWGEELVLFLGVGAGVAQQFGEDRGFGEFGQGAVQAGEFLGGGFAELADAHGEEPAVEGFGFGGGERGEHLGGVFLAEAARGVRRCRG